jgi:nesprin-1
LEVDSISEKGLSLQKQAISRSSATSTLELTAKYQLLMNKVKELVRVWQDYVESHQELNESMDGCRQVVQDMTEKLAYCLDVSTSSPQDLQEKLSAVQVRCATFFILLLGQ